MITEVLPLKKLKFSLMCLAALVLWAVDASAVAAPVAVNDENYGPEATVLTGNVGENDYDPDGDALTFTLISAPTSGTFTLSPNGNYTYVPLDEFNGFAYAVYRACDPSGNCSTATLELALLFVNDVPFINNDNFVVTVNTSFSNSVATNDYDVDIEPIFYTIYTQPTSGIVSLNYTTGTFTYTPAANFTGTATWTYYGCDPCGVCAIGTVTMTVIPPNDPPIAADDYVFMLEDGSTAGSVATNDTDPDGDQMFFNIEGNVTNGVFTMNNAGAFNYTPGPNFSGFQYVQYSVCDIYGNCSFAELMIEVAEINDAPVAVNDTFTGNEDQQLTGNVGGNDYDVDVEVLIYMVTQQVGVGTMSMATNGNVVYTPPANWSGTTTARYWAIDPCGQASEVATITFVVNAVNDAPVAGADNFSGDENTVISGTVATNDSDIEGNTLSFAVFTAPTNGTLLMQPNGSFTYTPNANFYGIDQAVYRVTDSGGATANAQIVFQVISTNTNPELVDESLTVQEDNVLSGNVALNDIPQVGYPVTYSLANGPASGNLVFNADGTFVFTPLANFSGTVTVSYIGTDGTGGSDVGVLTIQVLPVNDAPISQSDAATVLEDHVLNDFVSSNDSDIEGNTLTYTVLTEPLIGMLTLNANGSYQYVPYPNENGTDSFEYEVSDGNGGVSANVVTITIVPVNDAPIAFDDSYSTNEDTSISSALGDNDFDLDGDALVYTLTILPAHGSMQFNADGTFTYTPDLHFFGTETIPVSIYDGQDGLVSTTLTIEITSVNDLPSVVGESYFIAEDALLTGNVSTNDGDADGDNLQYTLISDVLNGTLTLNANGTFSYLPNSGYSGNDVFVYQANDGNGGTVNGTASIFINSVNSPPVAGNDSFGIDEDEVLVASVATNDSDVETTNLNFTLLTDVSEGTLLFNANGTFTYHSFTNFTGDDSFTYAVSDGVNSTTAIVYLTVLPVNDPPLAHYDNFSLNEDEVFSGDVSLNDSDVDSDNLVFTAISAVTNGVLVFNTDGTFTYTPDANYDGADYFVYRIDDGDGGMATANVNLVINGINDAPILGDDSFTMQEDGVLSGIVSNNDDDDDTSSLQYIVQTEPSVGTLVMQSNGAFVYTPPANYFGTVSAAVVANDGGTPQLSDTSLLTIQVVSVNDPTVVQNESYTIVEGETLTANLALNDSDADAVSLTYSTSSSLSGGLFVLNANGWFTFVSQAGSYGSQSFDYTVCDELGNCTTGTCTIVVTHINHAPVAVNDSFTGNEDVPIEGNVSLNDSDIDNDALSFAVNSQPLHGTVELQADGSFVYTPDLNFVGIDGFKYQVTDAPGLSALGNVFIEILPSNDPPIAMDDHLGVIINGAANDVVSDNDVDPDGDVLTYTMLFPTSLGTLVFNADGSYTYTPNADVFGDDSFGYQVCDQNGLCAQAVVLITIAESNTQPVAAEDNISTQEDVEVEASVATNDTDPDNNLLVYSVTTGPAHGTVVMQWDGTFTYQPDENFFGSDSFTYQACDIFNACDLAAVVVSVSAINDAPIAEDDAYVTAEDTAVSGSLAENDSDVETSSLTYTVLTTTQHGILVVNSNGSFTYTPTSNFFGSDVAEIRVSDGGSPSLVVTSMVHFDVESVDDLTQVTNDLYTIASGFVLNGDVSENDSDADALLLDYTLLSSAVGGSMTFNANGSFVFVPDENYQGTQVLNYQVCDEYGTCTSGTITITTTPFNHAPSALNMEMDACEGEVLSIPLNMLVQDLDEPASAIQLSALSAIGGALNYLDDTRVIVFEPQSDFVGTATISYSVCDNGTPQLCGSGLISVNYVALDVPQIVNTTTDNISCFGSNDGSIQVDIAASSEVSVVWNDGVEGATRTDLGPGEYDATITSLGVCGSQVFLSTVLVEPTAMSISGLIGFYDGTVATSSEPQVEGGVQPYTYVWTNAAGEFISNDLVLTALAPGAYTFTATDWNGCFVSQTIDAVSSVNNIELNSSMVLYPNPTAELLSWKLNTPWSGTAEVEVWDAVGRKVAVKHAVVVSENSANTLDVSFLANGTYRLTVRFDDILVERTFVKTN